MLKSALRVTLALAAVFGLLVGGAFAHDAYGAWQRKLEAAGRFPASATRLSINARLARISFESHSCSRAMGATMVGGVEVCDSIDLRRSDNEFSADCLRCIPEGAPSATCERTARAIALGAIYDNPCIR